MAASLCLNMQLLDRIRERHLPPSRHFEHHYLTSTSSISSNTFTHHTPPHPSRHHTNALTSISPHTTTLAPSRTSPLRAAATSTTTTSSAATPDSARVALRDLSFLYSPSQPSCRARCKISSSTTMRRRRVRSASRSSISRTRAFVRVPVATRCVTCLDTI